ncbi:MAG TPA: GNAT family N-acetyltransferase [Rhodanobacteraceae bacterium]
MISVSVHPSIDALAPADWNHLFPNEIEDHAYLRAIEHAGLPGFRYRYFAAHEDGQLVAAVPAFVTDYRVATTMEGAAHAIIAGLTPLIPWLLKIPMLSLGSPVTERCRVGFAPGSTAAQRAAWLDAILTQMDATAVTEHFRMLAIKDAPAGEPAWQTLCPRHGLRALPGLQGATLDIPWRSVDDYIATLGAATRKNLRREQRGGETLTIAWRTDLDGIADDVQRLYRHTLAHAEFSFEELTPAYFANVLRDMPGRAFCVTYHEGARLVAFNLMLHDGDRLLDKFLGMDYAAQDRYHLYHVTWLENIRYCIEHGIGVYESGQGLQKEKAKLGSTLHANTLWYRHRNRIIDALFARFDTLARVDRLDAADVIRPARAA